MSDEPVNETPVVETPAEATPEVAKPKKPKKAKLMQATCRHCGTQQYVPMSVYKENAPHCCGQCGSYGPAQYILDFNQEVSE